MPKIISANEAKNRLGSWLGYVNEHDEEVLIERHGKPRAVLMSAAAFEEVRTLREQKRRADAVQDLRALRDHVSGRNQELTEDEIAEIADRFSRDVIDDMAAEGEAVFERDIHQRD